MLVRQLSDSECNDGDNPHHGTIWVNNGCAGVFADRGNVTAAASVTAKATIATIATTAAAVTATT